MYPPRAALWLLFFVTSPLFAAAQEVLCEASGEVYRWRDDAGRVQFGDCPPADALDLTRIGAEALRPTLIQPPKQTGKETRKIGKRPRKIRKKSVKRYRSAKCRWLAGRVDNVRELVDEHRRRYGSPSIWTPELRRWRAEMRKARCRATS